MKKIALITGITGQDGAYLAIFLLEKDYEVHGVYRRASSQNTDRINDLLQGPHKNKNLILHYGDMTDTENLIQIIKDVQPHEIYNLAAQSDVHVSFEIPEYTANCDALGTLRLSKLNHQTRFYQASTSELFGKTEQKPQSELTPFHPRSPYAVAKLYAYWITVNYREAYHLYACNGILFNHESPLRGENFVSRKITQAAAKYKYGLQDCLYLGNLNARRDWGFAGDYVKAMWLMLQQDEPDDYVIATGETHTVREFVELAYEKIGVSIRWEGNGIDEVGIDEATDKAIIRVDPYFFRPAEVDFLQGNADKARERLGWKPETTFSELVAMMIAADLKKVE